MSTPAQPELAAVPAEKPKTTAAAGRGRREPAEPVAPEQPRSLLLKLNEIFLEVPAEIASDADGPQGHFRYPSINQVFRHLRQPLAERGILVLPEAGVPLEREYKTSNGNVRVATVVPSRFTFIDTTTGERLGPIEWLGGGQDDAEKGATKAISNALRTFLIEFFQLIQTDTGSNGGGRRRGGGGGGQGKASDPQKKLIQNIARDAGIGAKELMNLLRAARGLDPVDVTGDVAKQACESHLNELTSQQAGPLIDRLRERAQKPGGPA